MTGTMRPPWYNNKKEDRILEMVKPRLNQLTGRHNHAEKPHWEYDGYATAAPMYHVYRCKVKGCQMNTIHGCNERMRLGRCFICEPHEEA